MSDQLSVFTAAVSSIRTQINASGGTIKVSRATFLHCLMILTFDVVCLPGRRIRRKRMALQPTPGTTITLPYLSQQTGFPDVRAEPEVSEVPILIISVDRKL